MPNVFFTALLIFTVLLAGCEKDADIDVPKVDPKLVIQSYISPQDTVIKVFVSKTMPVFGKKYHDQQGNSSDQVTNAVVTLSNGNNSITLEYSEYSMHSEFEQTDFAYLADPKLFPIVAGETYTLKVSTPDGLLAQSSCTVPTNVPEIYNLKVDSVLISDYYNQDYKYYEYRISYAIKDIPNDINYYRVGGYVSVIHNIDNEDEFYIRSSLHTYNEDLYNDQSRDGNDILIKSRLPFYYGTEEEKPEKFSVRILVLNVDHHYYKYHQTSRTSFSDNPFQEPVLIYSNINGGIGVFSAFNSTFADYINE